MIPLNLESDEAEAVRRIAEARGIADAELIRDGLRDLDGYVVVLAGRQEDVDESG